MPDKETARRVIRVQREWNGWHSAEVPIDALRDVHWFQPDGAPQPLVHAFLLCTSVNRRELAHLCEDLTVPHPVRVCVLKKHNPPDVYRELQDLAHLSNSVAT